MQLRFLPWLLLAVCAVGPALALHGRRLKDKDEARGGAAPCYQSSLGYQCMLRVCRDIELHWSVGVLAPNAQCQYSPAQATNGTASVLKGLGDNKQTTVLHMALKTQDNGWVGLAFPTEPGEMIPADSIVGWIDNGAASVSPYHLIATREGANPVDPNVKLTSTSAVAADGSLVVCFSRPVAAVGKAGVVVSLDSIAMNFATTLDPAVDPRSRIGGNGGYSIEDEETGYMLAHGWLMIFAWALLIPFGMVVSSQKEWADTWSWSRGFHSAHPWFSLHVGSQILGVTLTFISLAVIISVTGLEVDEWQGLLKAHGGIALTIMPILAVHLLLAAVRPAPNGNNRQLWATGHRWTARVLLVLAFVNLMTGPKMYNRDAEDETSTAWMYVITFLSLAGCAGLAIWGVFKHHRYQKTDSLMMVGLSSSG